MATVASAASAPTSFALSEYRNLRFITLFLLYVAQGLPFGLIDFALLAWLAQNGASAAAIGGILAMIVLPWTFKLPYGFIMDRYAFLAMGRRRAWIIAAQFGLVATLAAMAITDPGAHQIGLLAAFAFCIGVASAMQDVAVDGLAVDILPPDEIERANGYMFGGQAIGTAAGAAVGGYLIAYHGLPAAVLALAAIIAAILILVLIVRERPDERLLPWTKGDASQRNLDLHLGAFWPIIRNLFAAMFTRQTLILIPAFLSASAAWGIFLGLAPLFATSILGWEKAIYSGWAGQANLVAGLVCVHFWGGRQPLGGATPVYRVCAHDLCRCCCDGGAAGFLDKPRRLHRRNFPFHGPHFSQKCHWGFSGDAAVHSGSRRNTIRRVHGNLQPWAGDSLGLAWLARQPRWYPCDVRRHGSVCPCHRRLRLRRQSGALNTLHSIRSN